MMIYVQKFAVSLCVKDVLSKISSAAEQINDIAEEIQEYVVNIIKNFF
jgi:hypothetical protein